MTEQTTEEAFRESVQDILRLRKADRKWLLQELHRHGFVSYTIDSLNRLLTLGSRSRRVLLADVVAVAVALGTSPLFLVVPRSRASVAVSSTLEPSAVDVEAWWRGEPLPTQVTEVPHIDERLTGKARKDAEATRERALEQRTIDLRAFYALRPELGALIDQAEELSPALTPIRRSGERELSLRDARILTRVQEEAQKLLGDRFNEMLERAKRAEGES